MSKKSIEEVNYLDTPKPEWLVDYLSNPSSSLDLSSIYSSEKYRNVDLTITDAGMPIAHRHWLTKHLLITTDELVDLNLEGCYIGDGGLSELADALIKNTTLRRLNLKDNNISAKKASSFLDVIEEYNFTLCDLQIDEGDKDAVTKNKNQYDAFDLETVSSIVTANESERDRFDQIKKRCEKLNLFNTKIVRCIDEGYKELEMIFHGDKGRSSGSKAIEFRYDRLSKLLTMIPHVEVLTFERFYPSVPTEDMERKWFDNLEKDKQKIRMKYDCIPDALFELKNLKELNFYDCVDSHQRTFFKTLPEKLGKLTTLKKLTISQCGLEDLDTFQDTTSSKHLNQTMLANSFDNLQKSVFLKLKQLEILSVPGNKIRVFPDTIGFCTNLRVLRIYNNEIEEIPSSILNLVNLQEFIATGNRILKVPLSLTKWCPKLSHIRILNQREDRKKKLSFIQSDSKELTKIKELEAKALRDVKFSQLSEYLNKFQEQTKRIRINRCKLMFVGDGAVGKTTTIKSIKRLIEKKKKNKENQLDNIATDGIDMHSIYLPCGFKYTQGHLGGNECINFNCWDFAGQDVFTYTHQFFLSEKAIYLIGFNVENELNPDGDKNNMARVDYWLQSVSMTYPNSPIIIFGTHADTKLGKDALKSLYKRLTEKYVKNKRLNVVKIIFISNATGKGLKDLLDEIKNICKGKKFAPILGIEREYDIRWIQLEEKGKAIGSVRVVPIISFDEWVKIAQNDINIENIEDIKKATQYLHDIGSLVWFNEEGLSDIICLRPNFLADVFSAVVSFKSGIFSGILNHQLLLHIWKGFPVYLYPYMLSLLEKFELTHRLEGNAINNITISASLIKEQNSYDSLHIEENVDTSLFSGSSIVPSLLPEAAPPENEIRKVWTDEESSFLQVDRIYRFDFIPNGFFSRLIVRLLHSQWNAKLFWRYGIILEKDNDSLAYLLYDNEKKEIKLSLRSMSQTTSHLGSMLEAMNALISDWLKNTEKKIIIPVKLKNKDIQVDFKSIEKAASQGATHVQLGDYIEVRLDSIAPDLAVLDDQNLLIKENDVQIDSKIGEGGYAIVYKGLMRGTPVAYKKLIPKDEQNNAWSEIFSEFRREVWLMSKLKHENIVELKGFCLKPNMGMALEMMDGDLLGYIREKRPLSNHEQVKLALDIAKGVHFMHSSKPPIIHRDLKSPNILIKKNKDGEFPTAKIADFGLSRGLTWTSKLEDKAVDNPVWLAPEILKKKSYNEKVDVYAFGVILYELASGKMLFEEESFTYVIEDKIIKGERPEIPEETTEVIRSLIERCWAQDMNVRPSFDEILPILEDEIIKYDPKYKKTYLKKRESKKTVKKK